MQIGAVSGYAPQTFKSNKIENPVSRKTEKNLAVLSNVAGSVVLGAIVAGIACAFPKCRNFKTGALIGLTAAAITSLITMPARIYNTNVKSYVKQREMDVFTSDRSLRTDLTQEVLNEVKDEEISLDKKLDDNLKLQMANRGAAIGLANITPQAQG